MSYTVWRRNDGYVDADAGSGLPKNYDTTTFEEIGTFEEWPDAIHTILTARGITNTEAHREKNCVKCWQEV